MKWYKEHPSPGHIRKRTRFLFFPKNIEGEIRWLEKATWVEKYYTYQGMTGVHGGWQAMFWSEEDY